MPKVICLHGPVGCGKTTLLNQLKQYLPNSYVVPEYIDALDDAKTKLQQYLEGDYSAFKFQNYILDYFEQIADSLEHSTYDYVFVERCPVEGILFFAKLDLINKRLTQAQYDYLLKRSQSFTVFPNPLIDDFVAINTDDKSPGQIAEQVLELIPQFHLIKLRASLDTIKNRIQQRGRTCEIEHYSDEYLKMMVECYV